MRGRERMGPSASEPRVHDYVALVDGRRLVRLRAASAELAGREVCDACGFASVSGVGCDLLGIWWVETTDYHRVCVAKDPSAEATLLEQRAAAGVELDAACAQQQRIAKAVREHDAARPFYIGGVREALDRIDQAVDAQTTAPERLTAQEMQTLALLAAVARRPDVLDALKQIAQEHALAPPVKCPQCGADSTPATRVPGRSCSRCGAVFRARDTNTKDREDDPNEGG